MGKQPVFENSTILVNESTLLLEPIQYGEHTKVYEKNREPILVKKTALKIIRQSCIRHLSTYNGRREASIKVLGMNRKVPLIIDNVRGTYLFPVSSHLKPDCAWITLAHIAELHKIAKKKTKVTFVDGQFVILNVSMLALFNQIMLTMTLYERVTAPSPLLFTKKISRSKYVYGAKKSHIVFSPTK